MRGRRKVFHLLFGLTLALGMMLAMSLVAFAADDPYPDGVDYIDEQGKTQHLDRSDFMIYGIDEQISETIGSGWHVIYGGGNVEKRVDVIGDAKIILVSAHDNIGAPEMRFTEGINVPEGSTLSIYGQTRDRDSSGKLIATGSKFNAGIGANDSTKTEDNKCGTINIYGGYIEATGGIYAAGIGGGASYLMSGGKHGGECGKFYMNGGWVYTTGGSMGAGLGGGWRGNSGGQGITIEGGFIEARGGNNEATTSDDSCGGAGIGGGEGKHGGEIGGCGENITINGGVVRAYGTQGGAGIGAGGYGNGSLDKDNWIKITGGNVYAVGQDGGAGIGGGSAPLNDWYTTGAGANVHISGGHVNAVGSSQAAGIGSARAKEYGSGETIIDGTAEVIATGGDYAAGIGTGNEPTWPGVNLKWNKIYNIKIGGNAKVRATGGKEGAGIGTGNEGLKSAGKTGDIAISGNAEVTATGGKYGAGIGGGDRQVSGKIDINGGTVTAQGGYGAAGIGSGDNTEDDVVSGDISITKGTVNATGGEFGAGIGGADGSDMNGKITIDDNGSFNDSPVNEIKLIAKATKEASGIGGGNYWPIHGGGNGCDVTIDLKNTNSYVLAMKNDDSAPIGHGDSGDSDGSLTLKNGNDNNNYLSVKSISSTDFNAENAKEPVSANRRVAECQNEDAAAVLIQYCNNTPTSGELEYTWKDELDHDVNCPYCDFSSEERHDASQTEDNKCTKCGGSAETVTVTFKEGKPLTLVESKSRKVGMWAEYKLPDYDPEKVPEGKRFAGWNREFDTGGYDPDINNVKLPGETVGVYLEEGKAWVAMYGDKVDISFDAGEGGRGSMPTLETVAGMKYYLPENKFEGPDDAKFLGWSDGAKTYDEGDRYDLTGDVTFTALWEGHKHEMIEHDAVDATCEKDGNLEYWECKGCNRFFKDAEGKSEFDNKGDVVVPATGHVWAEAVYTWTADGQDSDHNDKYKVKAERICLNNPESHKETEEVAAVIFSKKEATCSEEGSIKYVALFKNAAFDEQNKTVTIDKSAHIWGDWEPEEGTNNDIRECSVCHAKETRDRGHEHSLKEVAEVPAGCTSQGTKAHWECSGDSGCGKWYADAQGNQEVTEDSWKIPPTGHKLGTPEQYGDITVATCDEPGNYKTIRRCTVDGCNYSTESNPSVYTISPLGHDWSVEIIKAATCTDDGLKHQTCRRCGKTEDVTIKAMGGEHEWGAWVVTRPATATKAGERQRTCENCKLVELGTIAPTPAKAGAATSVTITAKKVNAKALNAAVKKAGGTNNSITTIVLSKKVKKISKGAFKNYKNATTLVVKTKKLKKSRVKKSLKGSSITKVKVQVGKKKTNKKYVKKYKKIFKKKNSGKAVKVTL